MTYLDRCPRSEFSELGNSRSSTCHFLRGKLGWYIRGKMSKKSPKGGCVHCLRFTDDITRDHVFPDSWYPESTPATVQRWTVPCCQPCNKELGVVESDLLVRLALC